MKSKRIRNHDTHITYTPQLLSCVLYTLRSVPVARMCFANIQPASKLLITMDSMSSVMIPSLTRSVINASHSTCILFTNRVYASSIIFPATPEFLSAGKLIAINYFTNRASQDCHVLSILNHGLDLVGVGHKLVCQVTSPLTIAPSSS